MKLDKLERGTFEVEPEANSWLQQLVVRHAQETDLRAIEWGGAYLRFRNVYADVYRRAERGLAVMWVAEHPDWGLVGQAFVQFKSNDRKTADGRRRAYMHSLRVRPSWRGRGVGTHILDVLEKDLLARGFREVTLNVARENEGAIRLYERLGYKIIKEIPGSWSYYDPDNVLRHVREPGYRMMKKLQAEI
jgi:ribosomal protein S18 acetylase RimI-like enzyme